MTLQKNGRNGCRGREVKMSGIFFSEGEYVLEKNIGPTKV